MVAVSVRADHTWRFDSYPSTNISNIMKIASKKDFKFDTFRCGGPGGQNQNKLDTGVRVTHIPSGLTAECRETRSQLTNKRLAFRKVAKLVIAWYKGKQDTFEQETVTNEVRTYNVPDNRVVDKASGEKFSFSDIEKDLSPAIEARFKKLKSHEYTQQTK